MWLLILKNWFVNRDSSCTTVRRSQITIWNCESWQFLLKKDITIVNLDSSCKTVQFDEDKVQNKTVCPSRVVHRTTADRDCCVYWQQLLQLLWISLRHFLLICLEVSEPPLVDRLFCPFKDVGNDWKYRHPGLVVKLLDAGSCGR